MKISTIGVNEIGGTIITMKKGNDNPTLMSGWVRDFQDEIDEIDSEATHILENIEGEWFLSGLNDETSIPIPVKGSINQVVIYLTRHYPSQDMKVVYNHTLTYHV